MRKAGQQTLLFVDEIHRFNRAQQDGFLPYVEDGTVTLVGATTENPSFELNAALLSRCQVLILQPARPRRRSSKLLDRAEAIEGRPLPLTARGARRADRQRRRRRPLPAQPGRDPVLDRARRAARSRPGSPRCSTAASPVYDKDREGHYNLISALHKAIRGSDPQAALYYLARMLVAGEEPLYLLRRLTRAAVEDIGLADPNALVQCLAAKDTYDFLGSPEGELGDRPGLPLSRHRAQIERRLHGAEERLAEREGDRLADAAEAHPQRADQADEGRSATARAMPTTTTPRRAFPAQDYGPRKWSRRPSTSRPTAASKRKVRERLEYWDERRKELQQSGARRRVKASERNREQAHVPGRPGRLLAGAD